jgi:hypothetical protein
MLKDSKIASNFFILIKGAANIYMKKTSANTFLSGSLSGLLATLSFLSQVA